MLNENDFNHLKLLYEQLLRLESYIQKLALDNDWESVEVAVNDKEKLLTQIVQFERPYLNEIKQDEYLHNFRLKLLSMEKSNLEMIVDAQKKLLVALNNTKKAKKILNAYEPSTNNTISTLDITQDD